MPSHSITSVTHVKVPRGYGLSDMFKKSKLVTEIEAKGKNNWRRVLPYECFHEWLAGLMGGK